jgi:hypothetical protein
VKHAMGAAQRGHETVSRGLVTTLLRDSGGAHTHDQAEAGMELESAARGSLVAFSVRCGWNNTQGVDGSQESASPTDTTHNAICLDGTLLLEEVPGAAHDLLQICET